MSASEAPATSRFPRSARVRARAEFDRIFADGRRVAAPLLSLHWATCDGCRLGLAVSRKVDPRAVGRNRIKRVLRDLFRHHRALLPAGDFVFVARPPARTADGATLRAAALQLLRRVGALPASGAAGTMPGAPSRAPRVSPSPHPPSDPPDPAPAEPACPR